MQLDKLRTFLPLQDLLILFVVWSILLAGLLYWNVQNLKDDAVQFAEHEARMSWEQDALYRLWSAERGGVYVLMNNDTPPNPYLKTANREVIIAGKEYTLVNPAYMTRQVYELAKDRRAVKGHITSLNPLRPQNSPDSWEAKALQSFEQGNKEYSEIVNMDGKVHFRLMRPFVTREACLRCHAEQGYTLGDIRGGISIAIPLDKYLAGYKNSVYKLYFAYFLIWLTGMVIIFRANSNLKQTVNKLHCSENNSKSMLKNLDQAGFGFYTVGSDYQIQHINKTMQKWFGDQAGTVCYSTLYGRTSPCDECYLDEVINKGRTIRYDFINGKQILDIIAMPLPQHDGSIAKMEVLLDVTDNKHNENEQRRARENAEAATASQTAFLANMSHDIRTPLNGIIGMLRLVLEQDLPPEQWKNLKSAKTSADFLLSLLNNILDISKIDADQLVLDKHPFGLAALLADIKSLFTVTASKKKLRLKVNIDKDIPAVLRGDSLRLRQVLMNLVGNAIKFTDKGCISITAQLQSSQEGRAVVHFLVADNGIGIAPEKKQTIFESFSQADSSTTRKYGGTGLGLAICKRLVENMGGRIWVESEEGRGSTFHFTVVFSIGSLDELTCSGKGPAGDCQFCSSLAILLVEDNELNRDVARMTLENFGHSVYSVANGLQALEAMIEKSFDVVLMDVQMPIMDGLTAARFIRSCEQGTVPESGEFAEIHARLLERIYNSRIPIVALTANAMNEDRDQCFRAGMNDYLSKPFQPDQVIATLNRVSKMMSSKNVKDEVPKDSLKDAVPVEEPDSDITRFVREHLRQEYHLDPEQVADMLEVTRKSLADNLEKADAAVKNGDDQALASQAHAIKGTLLTLGLSEWSEKVQAIETAAKKGRSEFSRKLFFSLQRNIEENFL